MGGEGVAGYGFSIGRDAWRTTKKNAGFWLALSLVFAAVSLPYIASQRLVRFSGRAGIAWFVCTLVGNLLLWAVGAVLFLVIVGAILAVVFDAGTTPSDMAQVAGQSSDAAVGVYLVASLAAVSLLGSLHGVFIRPTRMRAARVQQLNEQFLIDHDISETGGEEVTHVDGDGHRLRLLEINSREAVFLGVGRRGKRAYIRLDDAGVMRDYSGLQ